MKEKNLFFALYLKIIAIFVLLLGSEIKANTYISLILNVCYLIKILSRCGKYPDAEKGF